jgi:hypothetical protein
VPAGDTGALLSNVIDTSSGSTARTATARLGVTGSSYVWSYGVPGVKTFIPLTVGVPRLPGEIAGTAEVTIASTGSGFSWTRAPNAPVDVPLSVPVAGTASLDATSVSVFGWPTCTTFPCYSPVQETTRTCTCPSDAGACVCTWAAEASLGLVVVDASGPWTLGDFFRTAQVVRTAQRTWWVSENWHFGTVNTFVAACSGTNYLSPAFTGPLSMTRNGTAGVLLASAGDDSVNARVRVGVLEACPSTGNEPSKDFLITDGAIQPGADPASKRSISMAPVAGPAVGLLYVTTGGDLKYVE